MRKRDCSSKNLWSDQSGFTLVELMISIVMLAIISIPLLSYFSDAAAHNADSRTKQDATVEAQNILEELKNANYEITDPTALSTAEPTWTVSPVDPSGVYTVTKTQVIDNQSFDVSAQITPVSVYGDSGMTKNYMKSVIGTMDSSKDLMVSEDESKYLDAQMYFYNLHVQATAGVTDAGLSDYTQMASHLTRTIKIVAKQDTAKAGNVILKAEYEYIYNAAGGAYPAGIDASTKYTVTLKSASIAGDELSNIYVFFSPSTQGTDSLVMTNESNCLSVCHVANDQVRLFLVAQSSYANGTDAVPGYVERSATYKMDISAAAGLFTDYVGKVYTNLSNSPAEISGDNLTAKMALDTSSKYTLVDNTSGGVNRIADIDVRINKGTKEYAHVTGSKTQK